MHRLGAGVGSGVGEARELPAAEVSAICFSSMALLIDRFLN